MVGLECVAVDFVAGDDGHLAILVQREDPFGDVDDVFRPSASYV